MKKETDRRRKFARETLYPFLLKHAKSVHDASIMCEVMSNAIQQKFNLKLMEEQKRVSKAPLSDLKMIDDMATGSQFERDRQLLELLKDETVASAVELIGGMSKAIEGFVKEENSTRNLDTLKTHFL